MQDELISIIVPNYNNEEYIEDCLKSILSQTYKNIEIVVIDDASTDSSKDIIKKYMGEHNNIKAIFNEQNQGVTRNRDVAIKEASAEYITTLDSDDFYIDEQKLENEMNLIQKYKYKGEENVIAFSNIVLVNAVGNRLFPKAKNNIKEGNIFKNIFARECMIPRDFLFTKKQYLEVGGFDTKIPIYEDWDLKIRLADKFKFYYSEIDGIGYRRHGRGLSSAEHAKHIKWLQYIYKKNKNLLNDKEDFYVKNKLDSFMKKAFSSGIKLKLKDLIKKYIGWDKWKIK